VELRFLGAAGEVTGSCLLLQVGSRQLLIDCGLIQGSRRDEQRNFEPFDFDIRSIDAVVLSHAHLDHSGRIPLLVKRGYRGPVYTHRASCEIAALLLEDAGHLQEKDAEWENRKRERKGLQLVEPLYGVDEARAACRQLIPIEYRQPQEILPGVRVTLHDAGHILGSAILEFELEEGGRRFHLVVSGDLGHRGAPILHDPERLLRADLVVMESTYGGRSHRPWDETWKELGGIFQAARAGAGNILIPAFSVGRAQELLYLFRRHYDEWGISDWEVFLDSPLAIKATRVYTEHTRLYDREAQRIREDNGDIFDLPNLHLTERSEESMRINNIRSGAIIIAGSGMCTGGRIRHHLKHNVWRPATQVVMVGYQARGTLGRALVDGAHHVRLWGETIRVAAQVHTVGGLSAHADQADLLEWYQAFARRPPVSLVHGEPDAQEALAQQLKGLGVAVEIPALGDRRSL